MNRSLSRRLLFWLAPGLLVLVAGVQMTLVRTQGLTAWKGGGFGMFSTTDAPPARALRLVVLTDEGEAVVAFPNLRVRKERVLNMPNEALLEELAAKTVQEEWIVYTYDQLQTIGSELPEEFQRQLARIRRRVVLREDSTASPPEGLPERIAIPYARRSTALEGHRAEVLGARAEVWRYRFDADEDRLYAEVVNSAAVEAGR